MRYLAAMAPDRPATANPTATPIRIGAARGLAYGDVDEALRARAASWLAAREVPDGEVIKPGRVYRSDAYLVKFLPRTARLRDRLRPSVAFKAARLHHELLPIRTPRPWLALQTAELGLLVTEFVEGRFIETLWRTDAVALDRLVDFMLEMHRRHVFHGDFHFHNMIWTGEEWCLIDLESLRHPLRTLFPRRLIEDQWARLSFCLALPPELEATFRLYVERSDLGWNADRAWARIVARAERFLEVWGAPPLQPDQPTTSS